MTQPKFAPIPREDEVRQAWHLEPPRPWSFHRPGEVIPGATRIARGGGNPGPDQGYALHLVRLFTSSIALQSGEHLEDVVAGCVAIALRRAGLFGRAPVAHDLELAFNLFGYLDPEAPADLVAYRKGRFAGLAHDYQGRRAIAQIVPEEAIRLSPAEVVRRCSADWRAQLAA